jgi:hypothetical protein
MILKSLRFLLITGVATLALTSCGKKDEVAVAPQPDSTVQFSFDSNQPLVAAKPADKPVEADNKKAFTEFKGKKLRIADASTQTPPKKYGLVYRKGFIREWIDLGGDNSSGASLVKMKLHPIDLILGRGEGNVGFDSIKWYLTINQVVHKDPGFTAREDGFGRVNTSFFSTNCFNDRPTDTQLRRYCSEVFKYKGLSISQVAAMDENQLRELFYETKLPIILGNDYLVGFKSNANGVIGKLSEAGFSNFSFTENLFFLDQANQLGFGGVSELIDEYGRLPSDKETLLKKLRDLKIVGEDNIFYTGYGYPIDLDEVTKQQIRLAFSRVTYHNTNGSSTVFDSPQSWLTRAAQKWSYNSLKKDYPDMHAQMQAELKKINPKADVDGAFYGGIQKGDQVEVFAKLGTKIVVTKKFKPLGKSRSYTAAQVAFGDPFRRLSTFPQSTEELDAMIKDTPRFLKDDFYGFYNVK